MAKITALKPIADSGVDSGTAEAIFDGIATFAGYGFNKSHAAAYAVIAYQTAWLRTHHPEAYFAAAMNLDLDDVEALALFATELKARRIPLRHPCVNHSQAIFEPVARSGRARGARFAISYGLSALKGLGRTAAGAIIAERNSRGRFTSVDDFISRLGAAVNKTALKALVNAGAFDRISRNRAEALRDISGGARRTADAESGQMSMFDIMPQAETAPALEPLDRLDMLTSEFMTLGHFISGHPLDRYRETHLEDGHYFSGYTLRRAKNPPRSAAMPAIVTRIDIRRTRSGDTMAVLTLSDPDGVYEALAFGDTWSRIHHLIKTRQAYIFDMAISTRNGDRKALVNSAELLDLAQEAESEDPVFEDVLA